MDTCRPGILQSFATALAVGIPAGIGFGLIYSAGPGVAFGFVVWLTVYKHMRED